MAKPDVEQFKRTAETYVEQEVYDDKSIETEVVGMTEVNRGIRVGVAASPASGGLLDSLATAFTGETYHYATVTVDLSGNVVLSNRDLSRAGFYERIDRPQEAEATRKRQQRREQFWEEKRQEMIEDVVGDSFTSNETTSVPERCPECKESGSLFEDQFERLDANQFQCRNEDCGHIVNLD